MENKSEGVFWFQTSRRRGKTEGVGGSREGNKRTKREWRNEKTRHSKISPTRWEANNRTWSSEKKKAGNKPRNTNDSARGVVLSTKIRPKTTAGGCWFRDRGEKTGGRKQQNWEREGMYKSGRETRKTSKLPPTSKPWRGKRATFGISKNKAVGGENNEGTRSPQAEGSTKEKITSQGMAPRRARVGQ